GRRAERVRVAACTPAGGRAAGAPDLAKMRRGGMPASISLTEGRAHGNRTVLAAREAVVGRPTEITPGRREARPVGEATASAGVPGVRYGARIGDRLPVPHPVASACRRSRGQSRT